MLSMVTCPTCHAEVVVMADNTCPNCQSPLSVGEPPDSDQLRADPDHSDTASEGTLIPPRSVRRRRGMRSFFSNLVILGLLIGGLAALWWYVGGWGGVADATVAMQRHTLSSWLPLLAGLAAGILMGVVHRHLCRTEKHQLSPSPTPSRRSACPYPLVAILCGLTILILVQVGFDSYVVLRDYRFVQQNQPFLDDLRTADAEVHAAYERILDSRYEMLYGDKAKGKKMRDALDKAWDQSRREGKADAVMAVLNKVKPPAGPSYDEMTNMNARERAEFDANLHDRQLRQAQLDQDSALLRQKEKALYESKNSQKAVLISAAIDFRKKLAFELGLLLICLPLSTFVFASTRERGITVPLLGASLLIIAISMLYITATHGITPRITESDGCFFFASMIGSTMCGSLLVGYGVKQWLHPVA